MSQETKVQVVDSPNYRVDLRGFVKGYPDIPLQQTEASHMIDGKSERAHVLLEASPEREKLEFAEAHEAGERELRLVHTEDYLLSLKLHPRNVLEYLEIESDALDGENTILSDCIDRQVLRPMRYVVGGTVDAGIGALESRVAVNLGGGYHHASADMGGGFCIYNDVAVAIRCMQESGALEKALIVDLDVHQGDGNARIFEGDTNVFVFSMHDKTIFPFEKPKSDLDVGLKKGTRDGRYMQLLRKHLPQVLDQFKPEIIFYLAGADVFTMDPLGSLDISMQGILQRDVYVASEAIKREVPVAITLGGGYFKECPEIQAKSIEEIAKLV